MKYLTSKDWWSKAGVRAIKTFCQTALGIIGAGTLITSVNWLMVISGAVLAAITSLLTSLAGLPEVDESDIM